MRITRARPLLGTMVVIHVQTTPDQAATAEHAIARAFCTLAHIHQVMSAHHEDSDLGRLSRAGAHQTLTLDADTVHVIRAAHQWSALSRGAFDPCKAAHILARNRRRPGIEHAATGTLRDIHLLSATTVHVEQSVRLDFGGIAKGYAVDRAIETLQTHGISDALVNAGGDMRALGPRSWSVEARHSQAELMDGRLRAIKHLRHHALATSVCGALNPDFVMTRPSRRPRWRSVTVQASTCMAADVLTKWAMSSSLCCPDLRAALRHHHGRMWRTP